MLYTTFAKIIFLQGSVISVDYRKPKLRRKAKHQNFKSRL